MNFRKYYEQIDFDIRKRLNNSFSAKQGDNMSRGFYVRVVQDNQVVELSSTTTMQARFLLPNGKKPEPVVAVKDNSKFRIDIPSEVLALAGTVAGELELIGSGGQLITDDRFTIYVKASIRMDNSNTGGAIPTEFELLKQVVDGKADKTYVDNRVKTPVPEGAKFTDTIVDISGKVDKVAGKGLSANDYTNEDKAEVAKVKDKADKRYVDSEIADLDTRKAEQSDLVALEEKQQADNSELRNAVADLQPPQLEPDDKTNSPGSKYLVAGDKENGFYGFVQPERFGTIEGNPVGREEMSASNLALALGITRGIVQNDKTAWMKFHREGDVLFHPVKPLRSRISWNHIYEAGAVYGDGTIGVNPPNGRAGDRISVDGSNNAFVIDQIEDHWRRSGANIANVGDTIVARGFSNSENNGEFTVQSITDYQIVVDGNLTTEEGNKGVSVYNKADAVNQDATVTIGGNTYDVLLLRGGDNDPLDSYNNADRDLVGSNSDWNNLVLPLHERAKVGDWNYKIYAGDVEDWGIGLTDETLVTHHTVGEGSYRWVQETGDAHPSRRVLRGYLGASYGSVFYSWHTSTARGWAPALRLVQ